MAPSKARPAPRVAIRSFEGRYELSVRRVDPVSDLLPPALILKMRNVRVRQRTVAVFSDAGDLRRLARAILRAVGEAKGGR